jgi:hypothetical protein
MFTLLALRYAQMQLTVPIIYMCFRLVDLMLLKGHYIHCTGRRCKGQGNSRSYSTRIER